MPVVDTSVLVAAFDASDTRQADTRTRMAAAEHLLISTEILVETLGVLKSKMGRAAAAKALEGLLRMENVGWEEQCDLLAAYRIYKEKNTRSLPDAIVVHHCLRLRTDALTFDQDQARILAGMTS